MKKFFSLSLVVVLLQACDSEKQKPIVQASSDTLSRYNEAYRPQIHFSPKTGWMNDPNGLVYVDGVYHMFFQYYPDSTVWGPMHWGHATSTDLVHWQEGPIALYPDSLGYIFSGSAVVDQNNTTGFGENGKAPLVAIFTHHDPKGEKEKKNDFQNQSLAYSVDEGKTWKKYEGNPVLKNPGITDFRDPKVAWHQPTKQWILTLATKDRISFFASPDLKNWTKQSEFGVKLGAHGGVWECPDLFSLPVDGKEVWVLLVSINPGGPNGGSATQYFVGDFDGKSFKPYNTAQKWIDYGPDNYAGVTWSNTGSRKLFIGWMSNWWYGQQVPTSTWRSAMTIPRELSLQKIGSDYFLSSRPVNEMDKLAKKETSLQEQTIKGETDLPIDHFELPGQLSFRTEALNDFSLILSNDQKEELIIGYDKSKNQYFIDRTKAGKNDFAKNFSGRHSAPRVVATKAATIQLIMDKASVELFADDGTAVMTSIYFSQKPFTNVRLSSNEGIGLKDLKFSSLNSIWQ